MVHNWFVCSCNETYSQFNGEKKSTHFKAYSLISPKSVQSNSPGCFNMFSSLYHTFIFERTEVNLHREQGWNMVRQIEKESEQSVMKQHESTAVQEPSSACSLSRIKTRQAATLAC